MLNTEVLHQAADVKDAWAYQIEVVVNDESTKHLVEEARAVAGWLRMTAFLWKDDDRWDRRAALDVAHTILRGQTA